MLEESLIKKKADVKSKYAELTIGKERVTKVRHY